MNEIKINQDDDLIKTEDGLVFNPYNPLNIKITLNDVQSILSKYGLPPTVNNISLYHRAFIHKSYTKRPNYENLQQKITIVPKPEDCMPLSSKSNERLEFLGDGILEFVVKYYLYRRFPKENEGFMTEKKIAIVKNETIGKLAYEMGLYKWLIISKHAEEKKIRTNFTKLGCLFEAFIGAMFLDIKNIALVEKFIVNILERHIDWVELILVNDNYKNILQMRLQKELKITPTYIEKENDPEKGYHMCVYICLGDKIYNMNMNQSVSIEKYKNFDEIRADFESKGKLLIYMGNGQHKIKKKAEQLSCIEALEYLSKMG
jgi:dsRNA-specific ribonuclease